MPLDDLKARNRKAVHKYYHTKKIRQYESELNFLEQRSQTIEVVDRTIYVRLQIINHISAIRSGARQVNAITEEEMDRLSERIAPRQVVDLDQYDPSQVETYLKERESIKALPLDHARVYYSNFLLPRYKWLIERKPGRTDIPALEPLDELLGQAKRSQDISDSTGEPKEPIETTVEDWRKARETKHQHLSPDDIFSEIGTNAKVVLIHSAKNRQ